MEVHFNATSHNINDIKCIGVEQVNCEIDGDLEGKLLTKKCISDRRIIYSETIWHQ